MACHATVVTGTVTKCYLESIFAVQLLSCVWRFVTPWTIAHQAPLSMGFPRQEHWSRLTFPSPGDLPDPGIKPKSPALQADSLLCEQPCFLESVNLSFSPNLRNLRHLKNFFCIFKGTEMTCILNLLIFPHMSVSLFSFLNILSSLDWSTSVDLASGLLSLSFVTSLYYWDYPVCFSDVRYCISYVLKLPFGHLTLSGFF